MGLLTRLLSLSPRAKWRIGAVAVVGILGWIAFFDSHSLYKRVTWHRETDRLQTENAELQVEIDRLQSELDRELSDEEIERIAREQYGMRREGETVYPIRPRD